MKSLDLTLEIKSAPDDDGVFEGIASPFGGSADSYGDVIAPGAYSESLVKHQRNGTMPLMLWNHNSDEIVGVWQHMAETGAGLEARGKILRGVRKAEEVLIMLKNKAVRGLSIGYRTVEQEPQGRTNLLKKLDLLEVSVCAFPAQPRARVTSVKSEEFASGWEELARSIRDEEPLPAKEFERLLRDAGISKSVAVRIASKGYNDLFRSESGKTKDAPSNSAALAELKAIAAGILQA